MNTKHWIKHSNLLDEKPSDEQLKALEHILKDPQFYRLSTSNPHLINGDLSEQTFSNDAFNKNPLTGHTADQFLNDETFFNQNYFKVKDNPTDETFLNQNPVKIITEEPIQQQEPIMTSSSTDNQSIKIDAFTPVYLKKDNELDREFYKNQFLNNKLLNNHMQNDDLIDFQTKEQLQDVIKPIKIIQSDLI